MADYASNEIKTGIFVSFTLGLLLWLLFQIGGLQQTRGMRDIRVQFTEVGGLKKGSVVMFAGVDIGQVQEVQVLPDHNPAVELLLRIRQDVTIKSDSRIQLASMGLMGERVIQITPGTPESLPADLAQPLVGLPSPTMDQLIEQGTQAAEEAKIAISEIRGVIGENRQDVRETLAYMRGAGRNAEQFTNVLKRQPWRLLTRGTIKYGDEDLQPPIEELKDKKSMKETQRDRSSASARTQGGNRGSF